MKFSILNKIAFRSIVAHKKIYFPYVIAIILLFSLEYILLSLMQNEYVLEFHADLKMILGMGIFFSTILIVIITFYTSHFIQKNQTEEFGLYSVLGLEKKHVRFVMLIQNSFNWLVTTIFSVVCGYLLGSLLFIALNRLMQDTGATLMDYPFQLDTAMGVAGLLLMTFVVVFVVNSLKIARLNPIHLFTSARKGEGEPKGRIWMTILGLATLGGGYYIALTTNNVLSSLSNVFLAILLVMIGTYFLFLSFSILILKMLRKNKTFYYKPNNFLSVSGMLHRMNNNAVSLASIAILCSGVILVLGLTVTLYRTMETQIESIAPAEYTLAPASVESYEDNPEENKSYLLDIVDDLSQYGELKDVQTQTSLLVPGYLTDHSLQPLPARGSNEYENLDSSGQPIYILGETVDTYNTLYDTSVQLKEDEILITSNLLDLEGFSTVKINEKPYNTVEIPSDAIPSKYGVEVIYLGFSTQEGLDALQSEFQSYDVSNNEYDTTPYSTQVHFNVAGDETGVQERIHEVESEEGLHVQTAEETRKLMYELYGGLLFIGLVVSAVLLIGTVLMLYFKQISEGYQDRKNYKVMKQVGLPNLLIKKTIRSQIIWIFLLPMIVAALHNVFASKILYMLIGLFGSRDVGMFATSFLGVFAVFAIIYLLFYWFTSRAYYDIINDRTV